MGSERSYERRRSGYHLITHFQCDQCHFINIQGRDPYALSENDMILLVKIRRATLDAFWSRGPGKVKVNFNMVNSLGKVVGDELVLETWIPPLGIYPILY